MGRDDIRREGLVRARKAAGWTQQEVGLKIGYSEDSVRAWETGKTEPGLGSVAKLKGLFGKTAEELDLVSVRGSPSVPIATTANEPLLETIEASLLMESRRQMLHTVLDTATALLISPYELLPKESRERLLMAKIHPSYLDDQALGDLSFITARYWRMMNTAPLDTLISGASGHFEDITQHLKNSHPVRIYTRLCALASEHAQLLGRIFHLIRERKLSNAYYTFALKVALDIEHTDLWAAGVARMGLYHFHWGNPGDALPLLQGAQRATVHDVRVKGYLSAMEALIHAEMGNADICLRSLEQAKNVELPTGDGDICWTGFGPSVMAEFEGACFVRLRQPKNAIGSLKESLNLLEPTYLRGHASASRIVDMGNAHAQLGDPQGACRLFGEALSQALQTKSMSTLQRIYKAKAELDRWKGISDVRELDDQLKATVAALRRQ